MKVAEMRPPLIETSINQPKVVALGSSKKGWLKQSVNSTSCENTVHDLRVLTMEYYLSICV